MTPAAVHHGEAQQLHAARVLEAGYARNPERFVRRAPVAPELPTAPWINKPNTKGGRSLNSKSDRLIRLDRLRPIDPGPSGVAPARVFTHEAYYGRGPAPQFPRR